MRLLIQNTAYYYFHAVVICNNNYSDNTSPAYEHHLHSYRLEIGLLLEKEGAYASF